VIAVTDAHDEMARERDAAVDRSRVAIEARDAAKRERDEALAEKEAMAEMLRVSMSETKKLKREADSLDVHISELRAELDALKTAAIKTAHKIIAETPVEVAEVAEVAREAEQPMPAQSDDAALNTALRARYRALNTPLRAFVSKHNITRTPFQKWVAGERDMHGETLAKYEAAIRSEE
jgi:hypothetical protein